MNLLIHFFKGFWIVKFRPGPYPLLWLKPPNLERYLNQDATRKSVCVCGNKLSNLVINEYIPQFIRLWAVVLKDEKASNAAISEIKTVKVHNLRPRSCCNPRDGPNIRSFLFGIRSDLRLKGLFNNCTTSPAQISISIHVAASVSRIGHMIALLLLVVDHFGPIRDTIFSTVAVTGIKK